MKTYTRDGGKETFGFINGQESLVKVVDGRDMKVLNADCAGVLDNVFA
jgi:hypothetical protein